MNAVTYSGASESLQRYDAQRRRNAESAYHRDLQYNGQNQKTLAELEDLLTGKKEPETVRPERQEIQHSSTGQMKQVILPIGKTLEETIGLWKDVRTEAMSVPEPSTADYRLAATASAKIMQTEAQIALHKRAQSEIEVAATRDDVEAARVASMAFPTDLDREVFMLKKRYEQAISSYSFHAQMKQKGFESDRPSFYKIA